MFELTASEQSYQLSLDVLIHHFMEAAHINPQVCGARVAVIDAQEHQLVFSNVREVMDTSSEFLDRLRGRQSEGVAISTLADIIMEFVSNGQLRKYSTRTCTIQALFNKCGIIG